MFNGIDTNHNGVIDRSEWSHRPRPKAPAVSGKSRAVAGTAATQVCSRAERFGPVKTKQLMPLVRQIPRLHGYGPSSYGEPIRVAYVVMAYVVMACIDISGRV